MKQVERTIKIVCPDCLGFAYEYHPFAGRKPCATCDGTGEVTRVIVELVRESNTAHTCHQ